jgi:hypothetical protein
VRNAKQSTDAPRAAPAPFWRTVRKGLGEVYDYLGTVLLTSALLTLTGLAAGGALAAGLLTLWPAPVGGRRGVPADWLPLLLAGLLAAILMGPLIAGTARLVQGIVAREDPTVGDLFREARRHARQGAVLAGLQAGVSSLLLVDLLFFATVRGPVGWLAIPILYLLLFWGLMLPYQWPLFAEGAGPPLVVMRKSALLVLDNLPYTLGVGLLSLLFTLVCAVSTVGLVLLWPGTLAFYHTLATRALLRRYGLLPPEPDPEESVDGDTWRLAGGP